MSTWGLAFVSLGLLLFAYHNILGIPVFLLGVAMLLIARSKKKRAAKAEASELEAHKSVKIKARK